MSWSEKLSPNNPSCNNHHSLAQRHKKILNWLSTLSHFSNCCTKNDTEHDQAQDIHSFTPLSLDLKWCQWDCGMFFVWEMMKKLYVKNNLLCCWLLPSNRLIYAWATWSERAENSVPRAYVLFKQSFCINETFTHLYFGKFSQGLKHSDFDF